MEFLLLNKIPTRYNRAVAGKILNVVGSHESVHGTDKKQIDKDMEKPNGFDTEKKPIETELTSRIQWSNIFTGNYDYMEKYTKPNNKIKNAFFSSWA